MLYNQSHLRAIDAEAVPRAAFKEPVFPRALARDGLGKGDAERKDVERCAVPARVN
jgi:hypothetical protein